MLHLILSFLVGMVLSSGLHIYLNKVKVLNNTFLQSTIAVTISSIISISFLTLFFWNNTDFVGNLSSSQYLIPLACSLLILLAASFADIIAVLITTALVSAFTVYYTGISINFYPDMASWINTLLTILSLCIFSCGFYCISGITPFPQSQVIIPALGLVILTIIEVAPSIIGISSAALIGVMSVSYFNGLISHNSAPVLGYIIGWLGLVSYPEYLLPCFIIFSMGYLMEFGISVLRKLTTLEKYRKLPYNSTLYQLLDESNSSPAVLRIIWSNGAMLLLLGIFQINSDNCFSLPALAALFCTWQQYRTIHWQQPTLTWKETNKEMITSIKTTFNNLFNKSDNDRKDDK